jgi:hypothetical protein
MEEPKLKYWKGRMQDKLHSIDVAVTASQGEIIAMANYCGLSQIDLVIAFSRIRSAMKLVAKTIEEAQPETPKQKIDKAIESGQITKGHGNTTDK